MNDSMLCLTSRALTTLTAMSTALLWLPTNAAWMQDQRNLWLGCKTSLGQTVYLCVARGTAMASHQQPLESGSLGQRVYLCVARGTAVITTSSARTHSWKYTTTCYVLWILDFLQHEHSNRLA